MKVALYTRVSTQGQVQGMSLDEQLRILKQYANEKEWAVQEEQQLFCDDGYSGSTLNRPALGKLRDHIAFATFDRLLITEPDRLARDYVHQALLMEEFESNGCQVEFVIRPMSRDPYDQLLLQIRGAVAQFERNQIMQRTRRGRQARLKAGKILPWVRAPFGYQEEPEKPRSPESLQIHTPHAEVVRTMFGWYLEDDLSFYKIAQKLTQQGIKTPSGKVQWNPSTVGSILRNSAYAGKAYGNRFETVESKMRCSPLQKKGRVSYKQRPREEWIEIQIPALVSEQTFELAQQKMKKNKNLSKRNNTAHNYLLRRLVSCGRCQKSMDALGGSKKYHYYACKYRVQQAIIAKELRCQAPFVPCGHLDELVWQDLCQIIREPKLIEAALKRAREGTWLPHELQRRQKQTEKTITELKNREQRLLEAYLSELLTLEEFGDKKQELTQRRAGLEHELREFEKSIQREKEVEGLANSIEEFTSKIQTGLESADFAQRRKLVELLIDRVVVTDEEVEIRYVVPTSSKGTHYPFYHLRLTYLHKIR